MAPAFVVSKRPFAGNWEYLLDEAIFTLPLNRLSEIIEDDRGVHIVRVLERTEGGHQSFESVQDSIREKIKGFQGGSIYGYMAFGTSAYSKLSDWPGGGVVGVHGTNEPWLIPGAVSHGCVRVKDPDIRRLSRKLYIGTPVEIR